MPNLKHSNKMLFNIFVMVFFCSSMNAVKLLSTMGRYFLLQHIQYPMDSSYLYLDTLSNRSVNVNIASSGNHSMTPIRTTVVRYNTTMIRISTRSLYRDFEKSGTSHVIVITSDEDIGAAVIPQLMQYYYASYLLVPVQCYGLKYYVLTLHMNPFISVLSSQPDTQVVININNLAPSRFSTSWAGTRYGAGSSVTVTLKREEAFVLAECENPLSGELSGTSIEANVPVGVISGNCYSLTLELNCQQAPHEVYGGDYAYDMSLPTSSYGKEFIVFYPMGREIRAFVYVIALFPDTEVLVFRPEIYVILRFHIKDAKTPLKVVGSDLNDHKMVAKKPVACYLIHLSRCRQKEDWGGPSIGSLIPSEKFFNKYAWTVPYFVGDPDAKHFISIVIKRIYRKQLVVTGGVHMFAWAPTDGDGAWSVGKRKVEPGTHEAVTQNGACFAVYLYGHTWKSTYLHTAGYSLTTICPPCVDTVSKMEADDYLDNDCDGEVDEEREDSIDNDNDTRIDEDLYTRFGESDSSRFNKGIRSSLSPLLVCLLVRSVFFTNLPLGARGCLY